MRGLFLAAVYAGFLLMPGAAGAAVRKDPTLGMYLAGCKGNAHKGACVRALAGQIEDAREAGEICLPAHMARADAANRALAWMQDIVGESAEFAHYSEDEATQLAFHTLWTCEHG